jgi:N-acetylglucosamine-6-sulfatase
MGQGLSRRAHLEGAEGALSVPVARGAAPVLVALATLASTAALSGTPTPAADLPPNVLLVVTDDQPADTLTTRPIAMPWLHAQLSDPSTGWIGFEHAYVATPMCCPSRATILTGSQARRHGVTSNVDGSDLDETRTLATALDAAGYRTALVGKYLNGYPWDRGPYIPPGWDRWYAKTNERQSQTYYGYGIVDQGAWRRYGSGPGDHVTDVLGRAALNFVRSAPRTEPWFLYFAPPASHDPWQPLPRHEGAFADASLDVPDADGALDAAPPWLRGLPPPGDATALGEARIRARETLLGVDEYLQALLAAVAARGELDRTVVIFLSDNGYAFGEHRWVGKQVPYEPSVRVPFAIRTPWSAGGSSDALVSNLDLAPTIVELAGARILEARDGVSLAALLRGGDPPGRSSLLLDWRGSADVPPWTALVTTTVEYIRWDDGWEELHDLTRDPAQRDGVVPEGVFERYRALLERSLARLPPLG